MHGFAESHAVLVGIDVYGHGLTPLTTAVADARAMADALVRDHGYSARLLLDDEATQEHLLHLLDEDLPGCVGAEDRLVLYFAGHGLALDEVGDGPRGFLLPSDARAADSASWLPMARMRESLARLRCRHLLVVLDCCFAGSFRWAAPTRRFVPVGRPLYASQYARFLSGTAWQALTSAAHDQSALDLVPGQRDRRRVTRGGEPRMARGPAAHSPFAAAVLRGLSGDADSSRASHQPDGVITATELHQYVAEQLAQPSQGRALGQVPGLWPLKPETTGEFVFSSPRQPTTPWPDPELDEAANPWLGLAAYREADAERFFGRERVVDDLRLRLDDPSASLLAVVGASGTGKSSVVFAGLVPRLEREGWRIERCRRLGERPDVQLEAACAPLEAACRSSPTETKCLLIVDQLEELFTQCHDPEHRKTFLETLTKHLRASGPPLPGGEGLGVRAKRSKSASPENRNRFKILITLRSDFEPQLANAPELAEAWARGRYILPPFTAAELRDVIIRPAARAAVWIDPPELVEELLDEVLAMPGALPLLSFVLSEMYRQALARRRCDGALDRALTAADYRATGGVSGALHRRADTLFEEADADTRVTIRRVLLRLVALEGGQPTRRRVELAELEPEGHLEAERVRDVVDGFTRARLLVGDEGWIEPAHDTLVLAWPRLHRWRAESAEVLLLQRGLWLAARAWRESGEDPRLLWDRDPRLPHARSHWAELNALERLFVSASQRWRQRRRKLSAVGSAALAGALGGLALSAWRKARLAESRLRDAVDVADEIVSTIDRELGQVGGSAAVRRRLLDASSGLLARLHRGAAGDLETLRGRLWSHLRRGDLARSHDELEVEEREYGAAAEIAEELVRRCPDDTRARHELAIVVGRLGGIEKAAGDLATARRHYARSRELFERVLEDVDAGDQEPFHRREDVARVERDLAIAHNQLGGLARLEGDLESAKVAFQESLRVARVLVAEAPGDPRAAFDLVVACDKLGAVEEARGELSAARALYEESLEIKERHHAAAPRSTLWRRGLAISYVHLAALAEIEGERGVAREGYARSRDLRAELVEADPENIHYRRDLAQSHVRLGDLAMAESDRMEARRYYRSGLEVLRELAETDPRHREWRRRLEEARHKLQLTDPISGD